MPTLKLYEQLITKLLTKKLDESKHDHKLFIEELDSTESSSILALYLKNAVEHGLRHYKKQDGLNEQLRIANGLISRLKELTQDESLEDWLIEESKVLRGMYDGHLQEDVFKESIPLSSISKSSLFTGDKGDPQVYRELKREIATADKVDLLVSFIKYSGLRLIFDDLVEHTKTKPLRVITTSYMGATDLKAVKMLADLPNTQVRISYDTKRTRLHAKAYYFDRDTGFSTAYIGSSNLSKAALSEGTEWNMKVSEYTSFDIIQKFRYTFETYWNMSEFVDFDSSCDEDIRRLKYALSTEGNQSSDFEVGVGYFDLKPFTYQQEILDQLAIERRVHQSYRNLVVAATGTGKTMVAAFDFKGFYRANPQAKLLFLAHREEILKQSMASFRGVLRDANFGELWVGGNRPSLFNHVFGSIQTLTASENLAELHRDHFDYIVLDESHHGAAESYQSVLRHFNPTILLGLTATPERMDGKSILDDFNNRIAYEIRLNQAIEQNLLCPFHYFGVTDTTDISSVKWQSGRYAGGDLSLTYIGDHQRDRAILTAVNKYVADMDAVKGIGFCVDQNHAKHMAGVFNRAGIASESLDSNSSKELRHTIQKRLKKGEIKLIFVVDLFNEGVDLPFLNIVLFLRPTDSATVFIQQLGRGLRLHDGKEVLTVLDLLARPIKNMTTA